jgi:hypothetical protein
VLARVGQRLLHDPVGVAPDAVGHRGEVLDQALGADVHAGLARLVEQSREVGERRLRALGVAVERLLAQHADHLAQVLERLVGARAHHAGRARDLLRRRVGAELEGARVHAQQRDPVGEHVVHLARDAGALVGLRLLHAHLLLGLGALGALPQRQHELAPRAHEHAPRDDRRGDDHDEHHRDPHRVVVLGVDEDVDRQHGEADGRHRRDDREAPVHGDREQRDRAGARRERRERAHQREHDRDLHRPAAPEPQQAAADQPGAEVEQDQRLRQVLVLIDVPQHERADQQREQEEHAVDEPVAARAPVAGALRRDEHFGSIVRQA